MTIGVFAETSIADCYFDGNEAMNTIGAAILDHSSGLNTRSSANMGCYNYDADMRTPSQFSSLVLSCNGIQWSRATEEVPCREFEESCVATARESSTPTPTQMPSSPTSLPTTGPSFEPSVHASTQPSNMPQTPTSNLDPCVNDPESFECVLQGLLEEETPQN